MCVCVCVVIAGVWCLWVIMALTPFPFIPGLLATASGRRNHMMGPFYLSDQFYPPFLISPVNLSQFSVLYSVKIFIKVFQFPVSLNSPVAWLWQGRIGGHVGTFDLILLYDGWVGIGFDTYLSQYYYTMDWLELGWRDIWGHITIIWMGWNWVWYISKH